NHRCSLVHGAHVTPRFVVASALDGQPIVRKDVHARPDFDANTGHISQQRERPAGQKVLERTMSISPVYGRRSVAPLVVGTLLVDGDVVGWSRLARRRRRALELRDGGGVRQRGAFAGAARRTPAAGADRQRNGKSWRKSRNRSSLQHLVNF